ncbi:MaoC/PaaZ C-terminal domain-containing protein [Propioniferax innocua]|uniref:MaoC dehydratase-like protein n=1 Tax=Propioniferax innocua TaxID=1753 RepID=A0A542ZR02_9ACTN|nr:MaoC/PaaZ C-terminal domain-containing protein [Propioniferax innocua]TQL62679.1 MaoC dehydratase-like protein [Propioniferax innocua]
MGDLTVLPEPPSLPREFARALLTFGRDGVDGEIPGTLVQTTTTVDRDRLMDHQRLCGFKVNDTLPPTYPHLLGFPLQVHLMGSADFPLPMLGMVHVSNEITVHRELHVDDELTLQVGAEAMRPHAKGVTVDLVAAVTVAGELAWESRSTYLHRCTPPSDAEDPDPVEAAMPEPPAVPAGPAAAVWKLPADLGRRYAGVAGDINPIHLHPWTAKAMGFPRAIAHGMWTYSRTLAALGADGIGTSRVWFRKPVLLPGRVALHVAEDHRTAALASPKDPDRIHLVLTHQAL